MVEVYSNDELVRLKNGVSPKNGASLKNGNLNTKSEIYGEVLTKQDALKLFSKRNAFVNKGDFNRCTIFAGSNNYQGAANLAMLGSVAMRFNVGYLTLAVVKSLSEKKCFCVAECTVCPQNENEGVFTFDKVCVDKAINGAASVAVGMGMTSGDEVGKLVSYLLENYNGKLILDADAINSIKPIDLLKKNKFCNVLITPHPKELAVFLGITVKDVEENSVAIAKNLSREYNVCVLLKGAITVVTNYDKTYFNIINAPSLAKAGSGDYLSGAITALCVNFELIIAAAVASYICSYAASEFSKMYNDNIMLASDLSVGILDFFKNSSNVNNREDIERE